MNNFDEAKIRKEFQDLVPLLKEWGQFVDKVLNIFLDSLSWSIERIQKKPEYRVKNEDSYVSKVLYRKSYKEPIKDTTDKVGTRIVLLNMDDVRIVSEFIEKQCRSFWVVVNKAQDIDEIREHHPEEFGYQSNHYIVKPIPGKYPGNLCDLLTCEIQVRTLLQHAYAETSHDTVYKKGHNGSPIVLRSLAVTMAFLETADEKIEKIYKESQSMITPKTALIRLMDEIYRGYVTSYCDSDYDAGITEALLMLYDESFISQTLDELKQFVKDNEVDILASLTQSTLPFLFRQPVVLFAFYAIRKRQQQLISKWPFTFDSLKQIANAMNISDDAIV